MVVIGRAHELAKEPNNPIKKDLFRGSRSVSNSAVACPNCGFGIAAELEAQGLLNQLLTKKKKDRRTGINGILICFLVFAVWVFGSAVNDLVQESKNKEIEKQKNKVSQKERLLADELAVIKTNEKSFLEANGIDNLKAYNALKSLPITHDLVKA